jgi:putative copper export protein
MAMLRPPLGWDSPEARLLIERFTRVAVIAFVVTALTGVVRATDRLHELSDLWSTDYGLVLALKCAGVLAMLALSLAWRRGRPLARLDAAVVMLVTGATALLAAVPARP